MLYLITWNAAAIIKVHADVHGACPDGAQRAAAISRPRASHRQALGPPSTASRQFSPSLLPPLPLPSPLLLTALRVGKHPPVVSLKVVLFHHPALIVVVIAAVTIAIVVIAIVVAVAVAAAVNVSSISDFS